MTLEQIEAFNALTEQQRIRVLNDVLVFRHLDLEVYNVGWNWRGKIQNTSARDIHVLIGRFEPAQKHLVVPAGETVELRGAVRCTTGWSWT